jgi:hypothetical protein
MPLDPPPTRSRSCPHCRQRIAVRRLDGRIVLLAEDAVGIFDAQRKQEQDEAEWTSGRSQWLSAAATVGASEARRTRLASAPISAKVRDDSRELYLSSAEAAVRAAHAEKRWKVVSMTRRAQASNLYLERGRPVPPPADIIELQQDALLAELRGLKTASKVAELVGAGCCPACRTDEGKSFDIAAELRTPRLPHAGCPKGLCACDWWIAKAGPPKRRRRKSVTAPT